MGGSSTRDLLQRFLGEWTEFRAQYDRDRAVIEGLINKVHEQGEEIARLNEWKKEHQTSHRRVWVIISSFFIALSGWVFRIWIRK